MNSEFNHNSAIEFDRKKWLIAVSALFLTFFLYSIFCCPIPAVNEPHYLTKAKHYWNPEFCQGDFFLESSNPHQVFYQTVGILTLWLSMEQTVIISRIVGYLLLAIGWDCFFRQVTSSYWKNIGIAWLFIGLMTVGNLSGEWIIGGIESKVFSYAFLLMALGKSLQNKNSSMMIFHGLSISFHPVVGIWGLLANLGAKFLTAFTQNDYSIRSLLTHYKKQFRVGIIGVGLLALFSLPGMIPAIQLLSMAQEGVNQNEANYIQVFYRLGHHLDPMRFPAKAWIYYSFQVVSILIMVRILSSKVKSNSSYRFVLFLLLVASSFALGGLVVGWRNGSPWDMPFYAIRFKLLKFYSFRLADVFIPMIFSVCLMELLTRSDGLKNKTAWGIAAVMLAVSFTNPPLRGNPSRYPQQKLSDWLEVCKWIKKNTPKKSLVFAPKNSWAFKWYAERPEFVSMKDCPQDSKGIVEWNNRLIALAEWGEQQFEDGYSTEDLTILNNKFGITHLVAVRLGPIHQSPVFKNETYHVYKIETGTGSD